MPGPCKRKRKEKEKEKKNNYTQYIRACMPAPPPHMPKPPPHEGHLGPPIWYGPPCPLAMLPPGAVCPPVLLPPGPYAPQSCNLRARLPPSPANSGTVCPPFLPSPGLYAPSPATHGDSTPLHIPHSSPRGLRASPVPPLSQVAIPHPSNIVGRHSPAHPVS